MRDYELVQGDCTEVDLPQSRLLMTDIPYGEVNRASNGLRNLDKGAADEETFELEKFLEKIYPTADIFVIFCGNEQYSSIYKFFAGKAGTVRQIIWAKTNPSPMNGQHVYLSGTENAVWFKKRGTPQFNAHCKKNVFAFPTGVSKVHPTEKNHGLLRELIRDNTNENDLVVDTCMGSGSTGLVALQEGRRFFGVELNPEWFEVAEGRLRDFERGK